MPLTCWSVCIYYSFFTRDHLHNMAIDDTDNHQTLHWKYFGTILDWLDFYHIIYRIHAKIKKNYMTIDLNFLQYAECIVCHDIIIFIFLSIVWYKTNMLIEWVQQIIKNNITFQVMITLVTYAATYLQRKLAHIPKTQIDVHSNVHQSYNVHTRICIHKPRARLGISTQIITVILIERSSISNMLW